MENDTPTSSGDVEVKLSDSNDAAAEGVERNILVNSDAHPQKKEASKEDYETGLDGEFIKVEKEVGDVKEISQLHKPIEVEEKPNNAVTGINLLEAEDKIKSLELQLETVSKELQHSESEKALLKSEVDMANEKLETVSRHCEELEPDQKRMKEEISAAEQKYNIQLVSHQEALGALDVKYKEVGDLKESFNGVSVELENSRKKLEELEAALASSASETRRLEKLSNEKSLHAEAESKRASELENMLELAKASTQDMEVQIGNLQEDLKGLHNKVSENLQVEEALNRSTLELSATQEKLKLSESQVVELDEKFAAKEIVIQELTRELDLHKSSQERTKEELLSLENLLSSHKDDMQSKIITLEEVELKLQQEIKTREDVDVSLKNQEIQMISLQEELEKLTGEKEDLLSSVADLNTNLLLTKELCGQLEDKFLVADQNFSKTDSLLSQALSYNVELEQKQKSLEELHGESRMVAETASQRNLELEGLIQSSTAAEEGLKEQLREKEVKLISAEQKNVELEEKIARTELKFSDAEREIKSLSEKIPELTVMLSNFEEERDLSKGQLQEYQDRISQLESSLNQADSRNSELVLELKDHAEMRDTHEGRAAVAHQRSLELEDMVQLSYSKAEDAGRKVEELELLLEKERQQAQNQEQLMNIAEAKYRDAEAESKQYSSRVSELSTELEAFKTKLESLEIVVQAANEKEKELTDKLNESTGERKKFEELSNISGEKLLQAENFIEALQSEIKSAQEKLESIEDDLKASSIRENDILEKLKSAEEQLEHQGRAAEQASARCLELGSVHESLRKESELKLQEAVGNFTLKDSEAKQLQEKIIILEEQVADHQREAVEASEKMASLTAELEAAVVNIGALEKTVEELKGNLSDSEMKLEQSFSENELLAGTNSQLRSELEAHLNEFNDLLSSIHAEKEATAEQLASHVKTIEELTNEHSRGLELNSVTESRIKETELQLHEALEKFTQRDSEASNLNEKLVALELQLKMYEEQLGEMTATAENRKVELEEALLKMQNLETTLEEVQGRVNQLETENEGLARANMIQTEQLATYETKISDLEMSLKAVIADKEDAALQLHSSKKLIEDLTQQLASDGEKLQSQVCSVMEENNMLNKMYRNAKEELQAVMAQLEEQKAREISINAEVENLKSEKELESRMELERDAAVKHSLGEIEAEHQRAILLENQIKELKQQLQQVETQYKEKVAEESRKIDLLNVELDDLKHKQSQNVEREKKIAELENKLEKAKSSKKAKDITVEGGSKVEPEVRSRDLGFDITSPTTLKSKKGGEGPHQATDMVPVRPPSGVMAFKFILGIALVSVIIGIILGKKYSQ